MGKEDFVGTWHLVSSEFRRADGAVTYPIGKDAVGLLIYTAKGYMAAQLMQTDRPAFASGDRLQGTPEELKATFEGYVAYFGPYTVDDAAGTVTHHIQGHIWPNMLGATNTRGFSFAGNRLTLSASVPHVDGTHLTALLIWERAV
jgi:hypothetical protein